MTKNNIKICLIYYFIEKNITKRNKLRPIIHEENTHLGKSYVTMKDLMVKFYGKNELSDVICEKLFKSSCKTSNTNLKQNNHK